MVPLRDPLQHCLIQATMSHPGGTHICQQAGMVLRRRRRRERERERERELDQLLEVGYLVLEHVP